jgi:periplasmic divalent cation tolerance protein
MPLGYRLAVSGDAQEIQVTTAVPSREIADAIARALVERRIAACVQIVGPVASTYRWREAVEHAEEWLCLIKTVGARYSAIESAIREQHPYETPEITATAIVAGDESYLRWIIDSTETEEAER